MRSDLRRTFLGVVSVTVIAVACARSAPRPEITAVNPSANKSDITRAITIDGKNFFRRIVPDAGNPDNSTRSDLSAELTGPSGVVSLVVTSDVTLTHIVAMVPSNSAVGIYDVIVHADGGDARFQQGYAVLGPPTAFFVSSSTEPAPGDSDNVTMTVIAKDAGGSISTLNAPVTLSVQFVGSASNATASPFVIAAGSTGTTFVVHDIRPEGFSVVVLDTAGGSGLTGTGHAQFIVGPPIVGRIPDATEIGATGTAVTQFLIEDLDGNLVATHTTTYGVGFNFLASCTNPNVAPASANMTNGIAAVTLNLSCIGPGTGTVSGTGITPVGSLASTAGNATFN